MIEIGNVKKRVPKGSHHNSPAETSMGNAITSNSPRVTTLNTFSLARYLLDQR